MKSIYNEYNAMCVEEVDKKATLIINDYFETFLKEGYDPRELSHYLMQACSNTEAEHVLRTAMKKRKEERNK